ncbi:hypothetical protein HPB52_006839 [Rhipicephalus sanguineus]|uniref:Uncharacterized protein n=1 Tax=Rhipicephalus sanguineus TaxID=34632 RepID=A0A9D4SXX4_RHISA|nr:hypothetical protein HPB52_006839 [Rhipicephalus sanguineus]
MDVQSSPGAATSAASSSTSVDVPPLFQTRQDQLLKDLPEDGVEIAGDGRCDSPGYSAKYCTYTVLATEDGQILHYEQIRVGESSAVPSSSAMEKEGLARCLEKLEHYGVTVRSLTTDRHPAIRTYCRIKKPGMPHYFDVWHINKGVKKKLKAAAKSKGCESIKPWIQSITNHLYWVAAMGQGDEELTLSMWRSLLNHICNIHHGHEGPYTECLHGPLEERDWMSRDSQAFRKLRGILENPRLLADLRHLSPKAQTSSLESFNNIRFARKSVAYSEDGMQARSHLTGQSVRYPAS